MKDGSDRCYWHNPNTEKKRKESSRKGGKGRLKPSANVNTPMTIDDIKAVLSGSIRELQSSNADVVSRNRGIGYLASILLSAIQSSDFEQRLSELERRMTT